VRGGDTLVYMRKVDRGLGEAEVRDKLNSPSICKRIGIQLERDGHRRERGKSVEFPSLY